MEGFAEGIGGACSSALVVFFFIPHLGRNNPAADCQTCAAVYRPLPRAQKVRPLGSVCVAAAGKSYLTGCRLQVVRQKRAFPDMDTQFIFIYVVIICRSP